MTKKKNAFTLVELVAVLVIMAIIAVIATPLILTVINKAKASANKRSVDAYGKAVELSVLSYLMDNGDYPSDLTTLSVEYSGKDVTCNVMNLNADGSVYLSECSVGNTEVRDDNAEDGWYHYGKSESNNSTDSNPSTEAETVVYNGIEFYTISSDEDSVTLLKAEPLTVDEVNTYGVGHINNNIVDPVGTAADSNGYGGMAYYTSSTCGYATPGDSQTFTLDNCTNDYANSEIKYVVDGWSSDKLNTSDLKVDETGYSARLLTIEELTTNLGYDPTQVELDPMKSVEPSTNGDTPTWIYNSNYQYFTMSPWNNSTTSVWGVLNDGRLNSIPNFWLGVVRPVITLYKSAL